MTAEELVSVLRGAAALGDAARPYINAGIKNYVDGLTLLAFFNGRTLQKVIAWEELLAAREPLKLIEYNMRDMRAALIRAMEDEA
jgi:uncharacterized membrane protein